MAVKSSARAVAGRILSIVPESVVGRILPASYRFDASAVVAPPPLDGSTRLIIAPVNYAGQAFEWCRAVERFGSSIGAQNMMIRMPGDFRHQADYVVPVGAYAASGAWHRRWSRHVMSRATHVIVEAQKQPLGAILHDDTRAQIGRIREAGIQVAMLCHGSDIRLPSRHAQRESDSPFADPSDRVTTQLEANATRNARLLASLDLPLFVSTPDLLVDVPAATWVPVVVRAAPWACSDAPMARPVPVVVHVPSSAWIKGSELIEPTMRALHDRGLIEYRRLEGVPHEQMPDMYRGADIVLEQFRIGNYGVAACEAMAAGRVVVGYVNQQVRGVVAEQTGRSLPIVQSRASEIEAVVLGLLEDRGGARTIAAAGPEFVREVHDGRLSAAALAPFLLADEAPSTHGSEAP